MEHPLQRGLRRVGYNWGRNAEGISFMMFKFAFNGNKGEDNVGGKVTVTHFRTCQTAQSASGNCICKLELLMPAQLIVLLAAWTGFIFWQGLLIHSASYPAVVRVKTTATTNCVILVPPRLEMRKSFIVSWLGKQSS